MMGCPDCGTLESDKHAPECLWMLKHPDINLLDPIVTTHVLPDAVGWVRREDIGPRTWMLPDGKLFQFSPGMPQELLMWGRFVTTIEHEPKDADFLDQGDWPREGCDRFFPEPGHCAVCDEWFDRDKVVAIRQSGVAEPFGPVSRDHPDLVSLLEGGPQRIDEVPT